MPIGRYRRSDEEQRPCTLETEPQNNLGAPVLTLYACGTHRPPRAPATRSEMIETRLLQADFSSMVASRHLQDLSSASTGEILEAYARDHLCAPHKSRGLEEGS